MPPKKKEQVKEVGLSRKDKALAVMADFNKQMKGKAQIKVASEYSLPFLTKRFPTGLLTLDLALRGGFPGGGISQIVGPRSSGKSYLYWQMIRQLQYFLGDDMCVLLAMTEIRADRQQARCAGVKIALSEQDIADLSMSRAKAGFPPFTEEQLRDMREEIGVIHELHGESGEDLYDGILKGVERNAYHLIVIDSIGSIMSAAESENETLSQKTYGGAAGVTSQFLKKLQALLTMDDEDGKARDVCIIGVNQVRDAIGTQKEYRSPGGKALEHAKFVDLFVSSGSQDGAMENVSGPMGSKNQWQVYGKEVNWKIEKGKAGIHEGGRGSYLYSFENNQADFHLDTMIAGIHTGVVAQTGGWFAIPNPNNPSENVVKVQGKDAFVKVLKEDEMAKAASDDSDHSLMNYIRNESFRRSDILLTYNWGQ